MTSIRDTLLIFKEIYQHKVNLKNNINYLNQQAKQKEHLNLIGVIRLAHNIHLNLTMIHIPMINMINDTKR